MSRARIVCSEILSRMSPVHNFDDKVYPNLNTPQDKVFNLCFNECSNGENTDVSSVLSEINTSMDDWLRQKLSCPTMDCIDNTYLNDINFLSTRDPDMCSSGSDVGLELILVNNDKKDSNLNYDKNSDLDYTDPLLNLVPMNEVLLRKTDTKCNNLLSGTFGETNKSRPVWDTLSIASRKSDCDVENNSDFADFNLLPLSFDANDHISTLEPLTDSNNGKSLDKSDSNDAISTLVSCSESILIDESSRNTQQPTSASSPTPRNKKLINIKRPNILRTGTAKYKVNTSTDKNIADDLLNTLNEESVFDFSKDDPELLTLLPDELNSSITNESKVLNDEEKKVLREQTSELKTMTGSVAVVSNLMSAGKTRIAIKTSQGVERFEGNTAELVEAVARSRRPGTPVEGEHVITSVDTANRVSELTEPDDRLVRDMLAVLGITNDVLYSIVTNLGMHMWVCPEHECRRVFNRLNTLKSHILSHYGLKPFKCDFLNCPWSFYTSFKLKRHRETHLKRKDFICSVPDCNRTFTTVYNLNTHLKLHERPARLKCLVRSCSTRFQTRRAMEMHLKTHELSLAPYKCAAQGCAKLYFSLGALTAHMRSHQHKEEELRCQWENCGRRFDKPCRLKAHMRMHTGDKPYVCRFQDCHWAFASSSKLKRHQYKHNNERRFRCTIGDCTKAFMRSEHLREHTFTHIAQRTFQCPICGEKCSAKATLYVHKKKFHPNHNQTETISLPSNSTASDNTSFLIALLPNEKTDTEPEPVAEPVIVQDLDGNEYEVNLNKPFVSTTSTSKLKELRKPKVKLNKSCARTYLPYMDKTDVAPTIVLNNNAERILLSSVAVATTATAALTTTTSSSSNHQTVYLSNLMLQDTSDPSSTTAITVADDMYTPADGTEYILLFDSGASTPFPESTVNLKDLD